LSKLATHPVSGLGKKRESEITELTEAAARERETVIDRYLSLTHRNEAGGRIRYYGLSVCRNLDEMAGKRHRTADIRGLIL
jgi:hypothetical protein